MVVLEVMRIKTIKHLLRWIVSSLLVCLLFLGIKQIIGLEFLHGVCIYFAAYYLVSSMVKIVEKEK